MPNFDPDKNTKTVCISYHFKPQICIIIQQKNHKF